MLAFAASNDPLRILNVTLVGVTERNAARPLFTVVLVLVVVLRNFARMTLRRVLGGEVADPRRSGRGKDCRSSAP